MRINVSSALINDQEQLVDCVRRAVLLKRSGQEGFTLIFVFIIQIAFVERFFLPLVCIVTFYLTSTNVRSLEYDQWEVITTCS